MKKIAFVIVFGVSLSLALVSGAGAYSHGWHGGPHGWHGGHYWGWYGLGPWWGYPYAYPYYYPYAAYPPYESAMPAVPSEPQRSYWYYCQDAKAYYPYVQSCPGQWMRVVPDPSQPGNGVVPSPPRTGNEGGTQ